jgi:hypothetical protein
MVTKSVTLDLPEPLYERYKQLAAQTSRSVEDELLEVVLEAAPEEGLSPELAKETAAMNLFNDKDLWKVARRRMPARPLNQLRQLNHKQQKAGQASLTQEAIQTMTRLGDEYDRYILLRSQAVMLLKKRGYDVSKFFEE